ncbi:zinc finger BED domain-containing protein RICESLEEPER 2-like [Lycium barbarum]|uniref:zinc finger BED domain-containing protein RICESLEEPER 2-like n=1 Tax=Lycium barbarum TaxID=112863 RepID=UPI00293F2E5F|nr:zinc finger BED domain-containing protein RICESLEEPER 2-like [Lycium barbarum]
MRWNSAYLMLNRAIEYENVFSNYADRDIILSHYLEFVDFEDGTPAGTLLSNDWEHVKRVAKFLQIFYDLTEKNMKEKFDKYRGNPEKMNNMIFISCVLDPRHKLVSVGFALKRMFGEIEGPVIEKEVNNYMTSLFGEYVKSLSKDKGSQLPSSLSSSSFETSSPLPSSSGSTIQSIGSLGSFMDDLMKRKAGNAAADSKTELEKYLSEENEVERPNFKILSWWKINSPRFPVLAEMARDMLAIPISSVTSECAFSTGGRILDSFRSSLTPKLVQALVCLQDWIRSEKQPVSVEEDLDNLEQLEQDLANTSILDD